MSEELPIHIGKIPAAKKRKAGYSPEAISLMKKLIEDNKALCKINTNHS